MNVKDINKYWHLLEALHDGKTIQRKHFNNPDTWVDVCGTAFSLEPDQYRVKPESRKAYVYWHKTNTPMCTFCESHAKEYVKEYGGHYQEILENISE